MGLRPKKAHATSVTKMGAQFASSVAFATLVSTIDQCHTARSPAKNTPASSMSLRPARPGVVLDANDSMRAHAKSTGSARKTRQKAVDTGPVSLTFTNSAEVPIAAAPPSSAAIASVLVREAIAEFRERSSAT